MKAAAGLLLCPHCRGKANIKMTSSSNFKILYGVFCTRCSASTRKDTKQEAIIDWNRRVENVMEISDCKK